MDEVHGGSGAEEVRHYFLKREGSESSFSVKGFKFSKSALLLELTGEPANPAFRYTWRDHFPIIASSQSDGKQSCVMDAGLHPCTASTRRGYRTAAFLFIWSQGPVVTKEVQHLPTQGGSLASQKCVLMACASL